MNDTVFEENKKILSEIKKNRNWFANEIIVFYNLIQKRRILRKQLQNESRLVQNESMKILKEFENLKDED